MKKVETSDLTHALNKEIPITKHMGLIVLEATEQSVLLQSPLLPNTNHKGTAFGGSVYSAAVLASWMLVSETLKARGFSSDYIVIQDSKIEYLLPVGGDFTAKAHWLDSSGSNKFTDSLKRKGLGRVEVEAQIICDNKLCANFKGRFVAQIGP